MGLKIILNQKLDNSVIILISKTLNIDQENYV